MCLWNWRCRVMRILCSRLRSSALSVATCLRMVLDARLVAAERSRASLWSQSCGGCWCSHSWEEGRKAAGRALTSGVECQESAGACFAAAQARRHTVLRPTSRQKGRETERPSQCCAREGRRGRGGSVLSPHTARAAQKIAALASVKCGTPRTNGQEPGFSRPAQRREAPSAAASARNRESTSLRLQ